MLNVNCRYFEPQINEIGFCTHDHLVQWGESCTALCRSCMFRKPLDGFEKEHPISRQSSVIQLKEAFTGSRETLPAGWWNWENSAIAFSELAQEYLAITDNLSPQWKDRGVVIVGGGKYLVSAYVTVRVLRHVGCDLPIELWHFAGEVDPIMQEKLSSYGVTCCDASEHLKREQSDFRFMPNWWKGWQLKSYAIYHSRFAEVLYLDADCYPVRDPSDLFDNAQFRETGAIFWPDTYLPEPSVYSRVSQAFGCRVNDRTWTESGQLMIDKVHCQDAISLCLHYNNYADYCYNIIYGDKDTFPLAWHACNRPFSRLWPICGSAPSTILQFDEDGHPLFQHRIHDKFRLEEVNFSSTIQLSIGNQFLPELQHEVFCMKVLNELRREREDQFIRI